MKEIFAPEKCPECGEGTIVEHYDTGWRCICDCGWYGIYHFDNPVNNIKVLRELEGGQ